MRYIHRIISSFVLTCQALVAAFQFLSRLPIPVSVPFNERVCRRSLLFFPLVGWSLGMLLVLVMWGASFWFPPVMTAVLVLIVWVAFSGGLHLDGWMDTADGTLSHRSKEQMLEIMRDSRVGAMGVIAAVLALLLKMSVLISILREGVSPFLFTIALIPAFSRFSMVWAITLFPYVRKQGIGSLYQGAGALQLIGATLVSAGCALLLKFIFPSAVGSDFVWQFVVLLVISALAALLISFQFKRKLDGMTGDTYGFLNEAVEMLLLLTSWVLVMHV